MANVKIYKSRPMHVYASSNHFRNINISDFLSSKSKSRSQSTIFIMRPNNHTDGEMDKAMKAMAISEIADLPKEQVKS